jgi:hypothetical protein
MGVHKMKVKTKEAFVTKAHRVISKGAGEIINMPDEDYEEVKDKVTVIKETKLKDKEV